MGPCLQMLISYNLCKRFGHVMQHVVNQAHSVQPLERVTAAFSNTKCNMPRLTNNSLAGLSATSDMPLTIASSVVNTTSPLVMSSVAALPASVTATTQSGVSSFVALAPDVTGPSLIGSSPRPNTVSLPSTVGTVVASSYAISPFVVPFPYVPSQPWPTASFVQRPPFPSPPFSAPTASVNTSSTTLGRPPFCLVDVGSPALHSIRQPSANAIPQPSVFPIPQQSLHYCPPAVQSHPSWQYVPGQVPVPALGVSVAPQPPGLPAASGMLTSSPEAFVVGPGFLPVPAKTVTAIISGQFVDLAPLLARPSDPLPSGPVITVDGRVVVAPAPKPPRRLTDIAQWVQAFSIYSLVWVTYSPARGVDLLKYKLLILRTHAQFGGLAWLDYDEAFRRDAAARHISDWSTMHVELYNFHTAAARSSPSTSAPRALPESSGARFATAICRSWNSGRCICLRPTCRYLHVCDNPRCRGPHRRIHCPGPVASQPTAIPPLLAPAARSSSASHLG